MLHKFLTQFALGILCLTSMQCTKHNVIPTYEEYTLSISKIKMSTTSGNDTIWYELSPADKNAIVTIESKDIYNNSGAYANPVVVKTTDEYIIVNSKHSDFNNLSTLNLIALAYGRSVANTQAAYMATGNYNAVTSGKMLLKTSAGTLIFDLATGRSTPFSTDKEVLDYNETAKLVLLGSNSNYYIYWYNENGTYSNYSTAGSDFSYGNNFSFMSTDRSFSFFNTYYDRAMQQTANSGTYYPLSGYVYAYHASQNPSGITNQVYKSYSSPYYYLTYKIGNASAVNFRSLLGDETVQALEISRNGSYILFSTGGSYELKIYNRTTGNVASFATSNPYNASFNASSTEVAFINGNSQLQIYNLASGTSSLPLNGTIYEKATIYGAYW